MADRIVNIETDRNNFRAIFNTGDVAEANMLRRAILSEIETYAIDIVIIDINTSPRHDEVIALRLGQLPIDHDRFIPPEKGDFKTHIDIRGPIEFTTEHIPGLPFKYVTPIAVLKEGQQIVCDVIVKKGQGKTHVKWRPVSRLTIHEHENGYEIRGKEIGMMSPRDILMRGYEKIRDAANRPPITIFSRSLVPSNIQ